jgi:hypothetical protein
MSQTQKRMVLIRTKHFKNKETIGTLLIFDGVKKVFECKTLELPWRDNQRSISSVPAGRYELVLEYSPRFKQKLWELKGVPGRSECKIHTANFARQLNGCIAPGKGYADLDKDGLMDVYSSRVTLKKIHETMFPEQKSFIDVIDFLD